MYVETLQKHLKSLKRWCSVGQPVCPGYPRQSVAIIMFCRVKLSAEKGIPKEVDVWKP